MRATFVHFDSHPFELAALSMPLVYTECMKVQCFFFTCDYYDAIPAVRKSTFFFLDIPKMFIFRKLSSSINA